MEDQEQHQPLQGEELTESDPLSKCWVRSTAPGESLYLSLIPISMWPWLQSRLRDMKSNNYFDEDMGNWGASCRFFKRVMLLACLKDARYWSVVNSNNIENLDPEVQAAYNYFAWCLETNGMQEEVSEKFTHAEMMQDFFEIFDEILLDGLLYGNGQ